MLGLRFRARTLSSCSKWGPLFIAMRRPLTIMASLVAEHRLQTRRLSSCGSRAQLLRGLWDLPRPGLEPVSPALAGRLSTTVPPRKPLKCFFKVSAHVKGILGPKSSVCVCVCVCVCVHADMWVYRRYPSLVFLPADLTPNYLSSHGVR